MFEFVSIVVRFVTCFIVEVFAKRQLFVSTAYDETRLLSLWVLIKF